MCFSAPASFALGGVLVPLGIYTLVKARRDAPEWTGFAAFPLAFGLQQLVEGLVWVGLNREDPAMVSAASRGFLFFSHFFWLAWVPFAARMLEREPDRKRILTWLSALGFAYGLSIFLPAFLLQGGLRIEVIHHSLEYHTYLIYEGIIPRSALRVFYALLILSALFVSSERLIRGFAILILVSVLFTYAFFAYAFISVWCFFAAGLSAYLLWALARYQQRTPG
ncbi:DUF6629 family protein [Rhodalgimonas zhirmunskyi]|uniref:Uncharacterized protein n=1 Tax=Rhodalgimonas zhirmunskyi TaxID=2964767 RepID=A0AAJ1U4W0_9RHOB|nr:DUF6629 family protein [Rhodoalgimonas zhirmunskyi]MDQ2093745.1 hypothetical protein [Rhodoalgimonas zhirmunskyi]